MSWGKIVIFAAEIPQGLLEWKPCGTEAAGPATAASSWTWLLEVLISNSSGEWNYTLCFFHSWLSLSVCISSGERRTQTPTETCSLTVASDPCPMGRVSIFLVPGARGRRVRSQETREEYVGPSRRAWCLPAAPMAAEPPVPTGVSHSQWAACGPGQNTTEERFVQTAWTDQDGVGLAPLYLAPPVTTQ